MHFLHFILFLALASAVSALDLPSSITPCKKTDMDCMKTALKQSLKIFAEGNKEYGVSEFDPLLLKKIHIPGNGGSIDLEQTYVDTHIHGLSKMEPKSINVKISDSECAIDFNCFAESLSLVGTYTAKGKMLLFTINGGGSNNLTLVNGDINFELPCEIYDKGGQKHLKLKNFSLTITGKKIILDFKNLVNNNPQLSQTVLDAMNDSNEEVFKFLKKDYEKMFSEALKGIPEAIFNAIPLDKLFLD